MTHTPEDPNGPSIMDRAEPPPPYVDSGDAPASVHTPQTANDQTRPESLDLRRRNRGIARHFMNELTAQFGENSLQVARTNGILYAFANGKIPKNEALTRIATLLQNHDRLKEILLELFEHDGGSSTANDFDLAQLHPRFMQPAHQPAYSYMNSNPYGYQGTGAYYNTGNEYVPQQYYGSQQHMTQPYYSPAVGNGYEEQVAAEASTPNITRQDNQDPQKVAGQISSPAITQEGSLHEQQEPNQAPLPNIAQPRGQYAVQTPSHEASPVMAQQGGQYAQQIHQLHASPSMSQLAEKVPYGNTGHDTPPRTPIMSSAAPKMYNTEYNAYSNTNNWSHPNTLPLLQQGLQNPTHGLYYPTYAMYPQPTAVHQNAMAQTAQTAPVEDLRNVPVKESPHSSAHTSPQTQRTSVVTPSEGKKVKAAKVKKAPNTAATEATFIHGLCGKAFSGRSKVKKHHWGAKLNDLQTTTGCWAKHDKPANVEWDDHPSCKQDASDAPRARPASSTATAHSTSTGPASGTPKNRSASNTQNALSSFPTLQHLPNTVEALVHRRPSSAAPFTNIGPYHTYAMPANSGMSTLVAAVNVAARVDAPQPQSRQDSMVAQLQAAASELGQKSPAMPTPALTDTAAYENGSANTSPMLYANEYIGVSIPADVDQDNIAPAVATENHNHGNVKREPSPGLLLDGKAKRQKL